MAIKWMKYAAFLGWIRDYDVPVASTFPSGYRPITQDPANTQGRTTKTMKHSDFQIGATFWCGGHEWRCTDIGTRTIIAVQVDEVKVVRHSPGAPKSMAIGTLNREQAHAEGWFSGPPYEVSEMVFDEYDMAACSFDCEGH